MAEELEIEPDTEPGATGAAEDESFVDVTPERVWECETIDWRTPVALLIAKESEGARGEDESKSRQQLFNRLLDFLFLGGPDPGEVLRRIYALCLVLQPDFWRRLGGGSPRLMFGKHPEAVAWRLRRIFEGYKAAIRSRHRKPAPFHNTPADGG